MAQYDLPDEQACHAKGWYSQRHGNAPQRKTLDLMENRAPAAHGARLSKQPDRVLKYKILRLVIVLRIEILDLGLGKIQLRLRELDN